MSDETKRFRFIEVEYDVRGDRVSQQVHTRPRIEGEREGEILDATLTLLATSGYERLTMDAVAAAAKASKATLYRRWSSKADLVIDAIIRAKGAPQVVCDDTGSLRGDLIAMACHEGGLADKQPLDVMASVITAMHTDKEFADAFQAQFVDPKMRIARTIFERAEARGEIAADVDLDLMTPLLGAVVLHRAFVLRLPVDDQVVTQIIDSIVIPAATHRPSTTTTRRGPKS